jgi:hypothetical protein
VAAVGVAAVAAPKVVGLGEDEVRAFEVEVLGAKLLAMGFYLLSVDIFRLRHRGSVLKAASLPFYSFSLVG